MGGGGGGLDTVKTLGANSFLFTLVVDRDNLSELLKNTNWFQSSIFMQVLREVSHGSTL